MTCLNAALYMLCCCLDKGREHVNVFTVQSTEQLLPDACTANTAGPAQEQDRQSAEYSHVYARYKCDEIAIHHVSVSLFLVMTGVLSQGAWTTDIL